MILTGTPSEQDTTAIPQTGGWVGIVEDRLLLVRTYADGTLTAAVHDGLRWGSEVELEVAP